MQRYEALRILDDPGAAPEGLARVVHEYPDLRPRVARHGAAPAELLDWLGSLGNPLVDAALAARTAGPTTSLTTLSLAALRADLPELSDPTPGATPDPVPDPRALTTPAPLGIPPAVPAVGASSSGPATSAGASTSPSRAGQGTSVSPGASGRAAAPGVVASSPGGGPGAAQPGLRGRRRAFARAAWTAALVTAVVVLLILVVLVLGGLFAAADDSLAGAPASAGPVVAEQPGRAGADGRP